MRLVAATARSNQLARQILLIIMGSVVIALAAQVKIPLPFSPVPITLQTAAVVLIGATLGARRGALAVLAYIAEGAAGLPFFAGGALLGPTGGYLVGFMLSAFVVGWLVERGWADGALRTLVCFLLAGALVYVPALPWLATFVGVDRVLVAGLLPFIPGDLVKTVAAAALWRGGRRLTKN